MSLHAIFAARARRRRAEHAARRLDELRRLQLPGAPAHPPPTKSRLYRYSRWYMFPIGKFWISVVVGLAWVILAGWIARAWFGDLAHVIGLPLSVFVIFGLALLPGYLNMQLLTAVLLDRPKMLVEPEAMPAVTVLTAAFNEASVIEQTIDSVFLQDYPVPLRMIVIDDGSTDGTAELVQMRAASEPRLTLIRVGQNGGKALALNEGLAMADTPLIATVDADTDLHPQAILRCVCRHMVEGAVAVAGTIIVRNGDASFATRLQEWDYLIGIASVKRAQAMLGGTMVAQGAFSVYDTEKVREVGGWPDLIGEDIVLTWALLQKGWRVSWEATAIAYTGAPETMKALAKQRRRWARGMIEGLRVHGVKMVTMLRPFSHSALVNWLFPIIDLTFTLVFIPGVIMALLFQTWLVAGPRTLLILPLGLLVSAVFILRTRRSLHHAGVRMPGNALGFVLYMLLFQFLLSPVSLVGYAQELTRRSRSW